MAALKLRIAGKNTHDIARQLGMDPSNVRRAIARCYNELAEEQKHLVERLRNLTQTRLEALLAAHWEAAVGGNREATQTVLQIIDRELKLFGLDRTPQVNVQVGAVNVMEYPPEELLRRARMVGLDMSDLGLAPQLTHDPNIIETEVVENASVPSVCETD